MNDEDEGEIRLGVTTDKGNVVVAFGKSVAWIGMPPQVALELAESISMNAHNELGRKAGNVAIEIGSIYGVKTGKGLVELKMNDVRTQMTVEKAREVSAMLIGAIESAITDELLVKYLTEKAGLDPDQVQAMLLDFRELKQGSRGVVYPS